MFGWTVLPEDRAVLFVGDTSLALWRNGAFARKRRDVGPGRLRTAGRSGDRVLLRARTDRSGDLAVRIADGAVDVVADGR